MARIDPFSSPKRRFSRAKAQVLRLDKRIGKFFGKQPYKSRVDIDPVNGDKIYKVVLTKPLPPAISDLTNDTLEAMRSVLDQTAFACAALSGRTNAKSAYFPIADDELGLDNAIKGRCKDLPPEIVTLFRGFKPYKGGNDAVWALNRACNIAKHRALIETSMAVDQMHVIKATLNNGEIPALGWDGAKNEIIFARTRSNGDFQYNVKFSFFICFGKVDLLEGAPVLAVLDGMLGTVHEILKGTIAEASRLKLGRA